MMSKTVQHPLESNSAAQEYFEKLKARAQKGPVAAWREIVETLTGGLPTWAARERAGRKKSSQVVRGRSRGEAEPMTADTALRYREALT
jgi:hypothetical protein